MNKNIIYFICLILLIVSCKKKYYHEEEASPCVYVIMDANNNLKQEAFNSINRMEEGISNDKILYVFVKTESNYFSILKIKSDNDYRINSDTIARISTIGLSKIDELRKGIEIVSNLNKIKGLVLWSHSTSWAPYISSKKKAMTSLLVTIKVSN